MDLFEETERLKLRLIGAYEKLHKQGRLTEEELESVLDLIDRLEDLPEEEVLRRLESLEKDQKNRQKGEGGVQGESDTSREG